MIVQFWFDFASTYSYPAAMRIEALAAAQGIRVAWRAFLLGPIFQAQGLTDSPFNVYPAKGRYMWRDLERVCGELHLAFRKPSDFPRNGVLAARIACHFADAAWLPDFVRAAYAANFEHDQDISMDSTITQCLLAAGQVPAPVLQALREPSARPGLRRQNEEAARLGLFGAPSFVVGHELFWGNDRLDAALAWCTSHAD